MRQILVFNVIKLAKLKNKFVTIKMDYFLIPDADKENSYDGGPKSMKVVGFMERSKVPFDLLVGDGSMVFQSTEDDAVIFFPPNFDGFSINIFLCVSAFDFCRFRPTQNDVRRRPSHGSS